MELVWTCLSIAMDVLESTQRRIIPKKYTTSSIRSCQYCLKDFNAKGHASHEKACKVATAAAKRDREYRLRLEEEYRLLKRGNDFLSVFL